MDDAQHNVAIAIGSNIGDRRGNVAAALARLRAFVDVARVSSPYDTVPVGTSEQPDFLNLACVGTTMLAPAALVRALHDVEREVGRRDNGKLDPRAIDLDLLLYDQLVID